MVANANASSAYFQGGDYVELLSAQGKAPASTWKMQGKILKSFDKTIKGNAFQMDGSTETKMQLPKAPTSSSSSLGLTQRFLIFQILVPQTRSFSIEIGFSDFQKIRRRLVFASAFREITKTTLHVQIPIGASLSRDQWMNYVFDLQALTEHYFLGSSYRSMESICISGSCRLKRIFTMKDAPFSQDVAAKMEAQLCASRVQRAQSKDASGGPTAVAGFADMKDIPKQFLFTVSTSCLPIPTEYFLISTMSSTAVPTSATALNQTMGSAKTGEVKSGGASRSDVMKPKSAVGNRSRVTAVTRPLENNPPENTRMKSAPAAQSGRDGSNYRPRAPTATSVFERSFDVKEPCISRLPSRETPFLYQRSSRGSACLGADEFQELSPNGSECDGFERDSLLSDDNPAEAAASQAVNAPNPKKFALRDGESHLRDSVAMRRKQHRQNVIAEIQHKLDQLTKEDKEEEERGQEVLLNHVSLVTSRHEPVLEKTHSRIEPVPLPPKTAQIFTFPTNVVASSFRRSDADDRSPENELLRSPEPMVLKRAQALKKPEIVFSSSIFSFDRGEATSSVLVRESATNSHGPKQLFDWDSLLEDSVGALPGSTKIERGMPAKELSCDGTLDLNCLFDARKIDVDIGSIKLLPRGRQVDIIGNTDDGDDAELSNLIAEKRLARQTRVAETVDAKPPNVEIETANSRRREQREDETEALQSSFDFSQSPSESCRERQPSFSSQASERCESPRSPSRVESEGGLSLDLTGDLCEADERDDKPLMGIEAVTEACVSPPPSDDEDSFDFDDLVVRDRDYKPAHQPKQAITELARRTPERGHPDEHRTPASSAASRGGASAVSKMNTEPDTSRNGPKAASTSSPPKMKTHSREMAKGSASASSSRVISSSQRRLASLLESTDWSQLPLSSTVASKASAPQPREGKKDEHSTRDRPASRASSSIELIYDPILRCYYDPVGKKYYALAK